MSLSKRLKQGVSGLTLLAMLASGCSFKNQTSRGSFFTVPFLPYTKVSYETLDKEGEVSGRKEISIYYGFSSSSMIVKNYDSQGNYLGEYRITKKQVTSASTGRESMWRTESVIPRGRRTKARIKGGYGSSLTNTEIYDKDGNYVETIKGMPFGVPRDFPFCP